MLYIVYLFLHVWICLELNFILGIMEIWILNLNCSFYYQMTSDFKEETIQLLKLGLFNKLSNKRIVSGNILMMNPPQYIYFSICLSLPE